MDFVVRSRFVALFGLAWVGAAYAQPLAIFAKFSGKFGWVKMAHLSPSALKSLDHAKSAELVVSFPQDAKLKKDKNGNTWFTFILADQAGDWKWHQTQGSGILPLSGGVVKAGTYKLRIPLDGIPSAVLKGSKQTFSIGPSCSGLSGPTSFTIVSLQGR